MIFKSNLTSFLIFVFPLLYFDSIIAQNIQETSKDQDSILNTSTKDSLASLVAEALENNPGLKAVEFQVRAIHASPSHVWYLDAPEIGIDFFRTPIQSFPNPIQNGMEVDYSLQQTFPFPGKISSRINVEHKHALMSEQELGTLKLKITQEVKTTYYELYFQDRQLEINRDNQTLMAEFIAIARKQYEVGLGKLADILRAQTELTSLKNDSITLIQTRQSMEGMLNALLNRKTDQPFPTIGALTPVPSNWSLDQIRPLVEKYHPQLQRMKAEVDMREAAKAMATKDFYPDFMVRTTYMDMTHASDFWSFMVSMNLPLAFWSTPKYKAGYNQSLASLNQTDEEEIDIRNNLLANAQDALLQASSNWNLVRISKSILIPQAEEAMTSTLSAYQDGKTDFLMLLDAYRMLNMTKLDSEMAVMKLFADQAELEQSVGLSIDEIQKKISQGDEK